MPGYVLRFGYIFIFFQYSIVSTPFVKFIFPPHYHNVYYIIYQVPVDWGIYFWTLSTGWCVVNYQSLYHLWISESTSSSSFPLLLRVFRAILQACFSIQTLESTCPDSRKRPVGISPGITLDLSITRMNQHLDEVESSWDHAFLSYFLPFVSFRSVYKFSVYRFCTFLKLILTNDVFCHYLLVVVRI